MRAAFRDDTRPGTDGGGGKESNLPSPTGRDNAVLKTGRATGPDPPPFEMPGRATVAGRAGLGIPGGAREGVGVWDEPPISFVAPATRAAEAEIRRRVNRFTVGARGYAAGKA